MEYIDLKQNLWYGRNCIQDNSKYIKGLLCSQKIKECQEIIHNGETALLIGYNLKIYLIIVDKEIMGLKLLERNKAKSNGEKYYHKVKELGDEGIFAGDDCWLDLAMAIKNKNKRKYVER